MVDEKNWCYICTHDKCIDCDKSDSQKPSGFMKKNPLQMLSPENFIIKYMKFMGTQYDGYQEWNLAGALELLAIVSDRRLYLELAQQKIFPNLWFFGIAESTTARKSTGMGMAKQFHFPIGLENQRLPDAFSPERFVEEISEKPHAFFWKDEAAGLLASMKRSYMSEFRDMLCDLYECGSYHRALRTSQRKGKKTEFKAEDIFLNVWFMTTPDSFAEYATALDVTSGWLLRFLFLSPKGEKPWMGFREKTQQDNDGWTELFGLLGDIKRKFSNTPLVEAKLVLEAWTYYQKWQERREKEIMKSDDKIDSALFGRYQTYALKLAMLFTISNSDFHLNANPWKKGENIAPIKLNEVEAACRLIDEFLLPNAKSVISDLQRSEKMKLVERVKKLIYKKGEIMKGELLRTLGEHTIDVTEALKHLSDSGEIYETGNAQCGFTYRKP